MFYLTEMGIPRSPVPKRLLDPQQEEEEPEGVDNEQFLSQLAGLLQSLLQANQCHLSVEEICHPGGPYM